MQNKAVGNKFTHLLSFLFGVVVGITVFTKCVIKYHEDLDIQCAIKYLEDAKSEQSIIQDCKTYLKHK